MDPFYDTLLDQLIRIEGTRLAPYRAADGALIMAPEHYVTAIGVSGSGMTVLEADVRAIAAKLEELWPAVTKLDAVRRRVLVHITFNLGVSGLLAMSRLLWAVEFRFWATAAEEMLISQWAKQEPRRATVLAAMIRTGRDDALNVSQPRSAQAGGLTATAEGEHVRKSGRK